MAERKPLLEQSGQIQWTSYSTGWAVFTCSPACCDLPDAEASHLFLAPPGPGPSANLGPNPVVLQQCQKKRSFWGRKQRGRAMGSSCCTLWGDTPAFTSCVGRCFSSCMMPSCLLCRRCSGESQREHKLVELCQEKHEIFVAPVTQRK